MSSHRLQIPSINFNGFDPNQPNGSNCEDTRIQIITALETNGCSDAIYSGVRSDLKKVLFGSLMPEMFRLPLEIKEQNKVNKYSGYIGKKTSVEYESLRVQDADNPLSMDKFLQMLYPEGNHLFVDTISSYAQSVRSIEQIVERMIFQTLGIEKQCDSHLESLIYGVRFAKYGDLPDKEARVSLPSHRDPNLITIVCQNKVEGLEVLSEGEEWIRVVPLPNAFTVMIGELITVITNGRLRAVVHRVAVDKRRYSIIQDSNIKEVNSSAKRNN